MTGPWIAAFVVLWVLVVLLAVVTLGLLRRMAPVLERAERAGRRAPLDFENLGPPPGTTIPAFEVRDGDGRGVPFTSVGPNPRVVVFVDQSCPACHQLTDELASAPSAASLPVVVVPGAGTAPDHFGDLARAGITVIPQPDGAVTAAFRQRAFPLGVAVAADGTVLETSVPNTLADVERLVATLTHPPAPNHLQEGARDGDRATSVS